MSDFRELLVRNDGGYFKRLQCKDGIEMSVQGNTYAYSTPRVFSVDPYLYEDFEVAFIKDGNFIDPFENKDIADFEHDDVLGYIPVAEVQNMYDLLKIEALQE